MESISENKRKEISEESISENKRKEISEEDVGEEKLEILLTELQKITHDNSFKALVKRNMENDKVIKNIVLTLLNTFDTDDFLTESE